MSAPRFVLLGLAAPRAAWFTDVSRWSTAGSMPIEFVRCLSHEELRTRLLSGRPFSAALLDSTHPAVDRDLLSACSAARCAPIVLADAPGDWERVGAATTLPRTLDAAGLAAALASHARPIDPADEVSLEPEASIAPWRGALVAVTGTGGCGTSTIAIGLAQALAARHTGRILLADLARRADQAMLHATGAVLPGLPELVERFRSAAPDPSTLDGNTFEIAAWGYDLLIGIRRPAEWTSLRPRALAAALAGLRQRWDVVIADVDPDVEGQAASGSVDVEERNGASRAALLGADVAVVLTRPGLTGIGALARTVRELTDAGVAPQRIVPVVNRSQRGVSQIDLARSWPEIVEDPRLRPPIVLPTVASTESRVRDTGRVPPRLSRPLVRAVDEVLEGVVAPPGEEGAADRIRPGSLGTFAVEEGGHADGDAA